jgi:hypothetical protein
MGESCRHADGERARRRVVYLAEINDAQRLAREKAISVFDLGRGDQCQIAFHSEDRASASG